MYNIKLIRSDEVYRQLVSMEKDKRNKYFKEKVLREFEMKFQIQQILLIKRAVIILIYFHI